MINLTPSLMLAGSMSALESDEAIRSAIRYAVEMESRQLGAASGETINYNVRTSCYTFGYYFEQELGRTSLFTEDFLRVACKIAQMPYLEKKEKIPGLDALLEVTFRENMHGKKIRGTRTGLRIMLMRLWEKHIICLPLGFCLQQSIKDELLKTMLTEVSEFFWSYDPKKIIKPQNHLILGSWDDSDFRKRAYRLFLSTDWHSFEHVNISDLAKLHVLVLKGANWLSGTRFPFVPMLHEMMARHESRLNFTVEDLKIYKKYFAGGSFNEFDFDDYRKNYAKISKDRKKIYGERRTIKYKNEFINCSGYELTAGDDTSRTPKQLLLCKIAEKKTHEAAIEYFKTLSFLDSNLYSLKPYPGREHIDIADSSSLWMKIFADFMKYREISGREDTESIVSELKILKDYLFCYLPWWKELYPAAPVQIPTSPANFERFTFFRGNEANLPNAPLPFLEVLRLRRKTVNSSGRTISTLNALYDYITAFADKYEELKELQIKNPVVMKIDFPKGRSGKSKTNKPPFSKKIVPYLIRFLYALEEFGMHLQKMALEERLNFGLHSQPEEFMLKDFEYELKFDFDGNTYEVKEVPNVFSLNSRTLRISDGSLKTLYIPHLSTLRLLIVMFETGLRGQSVQWLDRRLWDAPNKGKSPETRVYELYVNTDKKKEHPWTAPLIYRARETLLREQQFQESIVEENIAKEIPYEERRHSRFADVVPLFRNGGAAGKLITDGAYTRDWTKILGSFQKFYNATVTNEGFVQFVELSPHYHGGLVSPENVKINYKVAPNGQKVFYSPLHYRAIHTPHAMRSTYISVRSGVLDIEDIAAAVGHTSTITTYHYTVKSFDEIAEKFEETDQAIWNFSHSSAHRIRADKKDSALRKSWNKNPQETEKRFGFLSVSLLNERSENFEDGVEVLRSTPANRVIFRETHICPVGETCPANVIDLIHEPRRCGLCPLAVKSLDHAPAISAKMRQLLEQMKCAADLIEKLKGRKEPESTISDINERRKLDALEYLGWQRALEAINEILDLKQPDLVQYLVDQPEIVKLHLKCVAKQSARTDFILERILDSKAYPVLETQALRHKANILRQQLLANSGKIAEALQAIPEGEEIEWFLSSLSAAMKTFNLTAAQLTEKGLLNVGNFQSKENTAVPQQLAAQNEIPILQELKSNN